MGSVGSTPQFCQGGSSVLAGCDHSTSDSNFFISYTPIPRQVKNPQKPWLSRYFHGFHQFFGPYNGDVSHFFREEGIFIYQAKVSSFPPSSLNVAAKALKHLSCAPGVVGHGSTPCQFGQSLGIMIRFLVENTTPLFATMT